MKIAITAPHTKADLELEDLLDYLKQSHGFNFDGYKRSSLNRQVLKRMQKVRIDSYRDYIDYLEVHSEELTQLFNTLLNNNTCFFRDRSVWDCLSNEIVPKIIASKEPNEPIRLWSAGCASGEEAYTLAIVLAEALGVEQFRERVKIYATDIDESALDQARRGTYTVGDVTSISPPLLEKYFERSANTYIFRKDLRCSLLFGRHNVIEDAPVSGVDLLVCRNVLMYFKSETQMRILSRVYFAMQDSSFLLLGQTEGLRNNTHTFTPMDLKRRIYTKQKKNLRQKTQSETQDVNVLPVKPLEQEEREHSEQELKTDHAQLLITQEALKTIKQERLALIEELETVYAELQFTNAEVQNMNQELQSVTKELSQRNDELNQLKALLYHFAIS